MHLNSALSAAEMNLGPGFTYKSSTILGYKEAEHWTIYALSARLQRRWNGYGSNKSNENFQFTLISANSFPIRVKVHCNGNSWGPYKLWIRVKVSNPKELTNFIQFFWKQPFLFHPCGMNSWLRPLLLRSWCNFSFVDATSPLLVDSMISRFKFED
jgi:hypothetical protein